MKMFSEETIQESSRMLNGDNTSCFVLSVCANFRDMY